VSASVVDKTGYLAKHGFPWQPARCFHLKEIGRSPAHGRLSLAGEEDEKESASRALGSTVHALLEGRTDIVVYPGAVRRGKEWDKFKAEHEDGARIVLAKERDCAMSIADALLGNRDAARLINAPRVRREETIIFDHLGRRCRATPDFAARSYAWFAELKTTRCADPDRFRYDARRFAYHVQVAMQRLAIRATEGKNKAKKAFIIAVETAPPWPVSVMEVEEDSLLAGEKQMHLWLERLLGCEAAGHWPGYVQSVVPLRIVDPEFEPEWDDEDDAADEATP
jgi:hypothetical protein